MDVLALQKINEAAHLSHYLPYIEAEISKLETALENRTYAAMRDGKFTAEDAHAAWIEKHVYRRILSNLKQRHRTGQSIGEDHAVELSNR